MVDSKRWGVHVSQCRVSLRIVSGGTLSCQQDYVPALRGARVCAPGRTLVWHILPGR